jgi:hypothetical protein
MPVLRTALVLVLAPAFALTASAGVRAQDASPVVDAPAAAPAPAPAPAFAARTARRVFVAPFTGTTTDAATLDLVEDRVLVASRAAIERAKERGEGNVEVVGARDVQSILDVEAAKAAAGCDATSCANEIADALNAEEIVFGQLGHIGETWQLTLTRTERATLKVLGRSVKESRGATPEGLLGAIPEQVSELFDVVTPPPNALSVVGMGTTAVGAAALLVGAGAFTLSWIEFFNAKALLPADRSDPNRDEVEAKKHEDASRAALNVAYIAGGVGAGVTVVGAALWFVGAE